MKSLYLWLIGPSLFFGAPSMKAQSPLAGGVPRVITYQGLLLNNGIPVTGPVTMDFYFTDSLGYGSYGGVTNALFHQTSTNVYVTGGIFNVLLGDPSITPGGFPESMRFDKQYLMTIVINSTTTLAPVLLYSSPYALNAERVGGLDVSPLPINGDLFPMPLNNAGKIDTSMLPVIPNNLMQDAPITSINGTVLPYPTGNVGIVGANGITVVNSGNTVEISGPIGTGITGIVAQNGLSGGGTSGSISIGIADGGITTSMLATSLGIGVSSNTNTSLAVINGEANGNEALAVYGGIGAGNPTGGADGTGLTSGSPQTYWADQVSVPSETGTSIDVYNKLVNSSSTIVVTPVGSSGFAGGVTITSQGAGTFTISSKNTMGTSGGSSVTALNYIIINH